jgi:hypothetical protein
MVVKGCKQPVKCRFAFADSSNMPFCRKLPQAALNRPQVRRLTQAVANALTITSIRMADEESKNLLMLGRQQYSSHV